MNIFKKIYCRIFQKGFYVVMPFMPWRKPSLLIGEDSLLKLPALIKSLNIKSVLIVTDKGLMNLGLVNPLIEELTNEGLNFVVYDEVVPNPTISNIEKGAKIYRDNHCEAIIAFGGGSPMDCAKGIGARIARPNKPISKMKGVLKICKKLPPLFAIPTTAGTGSETTLAAVITNDETHEKYPINDFNLIPNYAVLDPTLTEKLPKHITSTTGMDALTHAVEAFIGSSNTKETKQMALDAIELIFNNIKTVYDDGTNLEARKNMQIASFKAGVAFTRAYVGYVHAVAHTLGGAYNVPHGLANAVILPYVLEVFGKSAHKKLAKLADHVHLTDINESNEVKAKAFIKAIKDLNEYMNIPTKLDIKEEDIPLLAKRADKEGNPLYPVPKLMNAKELEQIYYLVKK